MAVLTLTQLRDRIAGAHYNAAVLVQKQCSIYDQDDVLLTGAENLYAIIRGLKKTEREKMAIKGIQADMIFEIARQGTFIGSTMLALSPQKYYISYGGSQFQIQDQEQDDAAPIVSGVPEPAVYVFYTLTELPGPGVMA